MEHAYRSIGDAYIGPATLEYPQGIVDTKVAWQVAVAHHGDHVEIIGQRRLWYKVRTDKGIEGWADDRALLDSAQMARLRKLAEETAGLPSQGKATTYDMLNVHTEPNRNSASFVQVKEKETFDVITHRVTARNAKQPKRQLTRPKPKPTKALKSGAPKKGAKKDGAVPPQAVPRACCTVATDGLDCAFEGAVGLQAEADAPPAAQGMTGHSSALKVVRADGC